MDALGLGPTLGGKLNGERTRMAAATGSRVPGSPGAKVKPFGRFSIRAALGSGGSGAEALAKRMAIAVLAWRGDDGRGRNDGVGVSAVGGVRRDGVTEERSSRWWVRVVRSAGVAEAARDRALRTRSLSAMWVGLG